MKDYLLSVYQPDGPPPPPEALHKVMQDIGAVIEDAKRAGVVGLQRRPASAGLRHRRAYQGR